LASLTSKQPQHQVATQPAQAPTSESGPRPVIPRELPKFRCGTDPIQEPARFLQQFQLVLSMYCLDPDRDGRRLLPGCIPAEHIDWLNERLSQTTGWQQVHDAFMQQFDDPKRINQARRDFRDIRMTPGESLNEYAQRFEKQMQLAEIPDTP